MTALCGLHSTVACFVFITLRVAICEWPLIYSRHFCLRGTASILMAAALFLPFGGWGYTPATIFSSGGAQLVGICRYLAHMAWALWRVVSCQTFLPYQKRPI